MRNFLDEVGGSSDEGEGEEQGEKGEGGGKEGGEQGEKGEGGGKEGGEQERGEQEGGEEEGGEEEDRSMADIEARIEKLKNLEAAEEKRCVMGRGGGRDIRPHSRECGQQWALLLTSTLMDHSICPMHDAG